MKRETKTLCLLPVLIIFGLCLVFSFALASTCLAGEAGVLEADPDAFCWTYTTEANFNEGLQSGIDCSVPGQLQLSNEATTFSYIWIANAGEGTVSKIDTATGREVGRYCTAEDNLDPSRTAVDPQGNCWVANRAWGTQATVVKILAEDWVDKNHDGVMQTSQDVNGDGVIDPDNPHELLPWGQDERVAASYPVGSVDGIARALALDKHGYLWVGLFNEERYVKLDPNTGAELTSVSTQGAGNYGAAIDGQGILWGATISNILVRFDTNTPPATAELITLPASNYGIAVDRHGVVWMGDWDGWNGMQVMRYDPATGTTSSFSGNGDVGRGVAIDKDGNVWVADSSTDTINKYDTNGTHLFAVAVGHTPIGVGVDKDGNIWAVNQSSCNTTKVAPDGTIIGTYATGSLPYSYSDLTGYGMHNITQRLGTWQAVLDSETDNTPWGVISWNDEPEGCVPEGTSIEVMARSAATTAGLTSASWVTVQKGLDFEVPNGRYLEIKVKLSSTVASSPVLSDLTVCVNNAQATLFVEPSYQEAQVGDLITVDIMARGLNNLYAAEVGLGFNPQVFQVDAIEQAAPEPNVWINTSEVFSQIGAIRVNNDPHTGGFINWSASRTWNEYGYEGYSNSGQVKLATITFRAVGAGNSALDLGCVELRGNAGEAGSDVCLIPVGQENGWVSVAEPVLGGISGTIRLEGLNPEMDQSGVMVYLVGTGFHTVTNAHGTFILPVTTSGDYTLAAYCPVYLQKEIPVEVTDVLSVTELPESILLLTGDVVADNEINLGDLVLLRGIYGLNAEEVGFIANCDLNRSRRIDLVDLVLLARNYTKMGDGNIIDIE